MNTEMTTGTVGRFDARASDRVRAHTAAHVNARIDRLTRANIDEAAAAGREAMIARLKELDAEWDVDRALMANFAIAGSIARELGERHRGWRHMLRAQLGFLLMHAIVGWCPPLVAFRRLGFRTAREIAAERSALLERLGGSGRGSTIQTAT